MNLKAIIDVIKADAGSWAWVFIIASTLIEITPLKLNPISDLFRWLSRKFNKEIVDQLNSLQEKLDSHIADSEKRDIRMQRESILAFGNSIMNGRKHTKEEFDFIVTQCDEYEQYCKTNNIPNGVAKACIDEIRRVYAHCIRDNSFLKEGQEYGETE